MELHAGSPMAKGWADKGGRRSRSGHEGMIGAKRARHKGRRHLQTVGARWRTTLGGVCGGGSAVWDLQIPREGHPCADDRQGA